MQIDLGGVGLNLQAASVVILMEPQLKPSTEQLTEEEARELAEYLDWYRTRHRR